MLDFGIAIAGEFTPVANDSRGDSDGDCIVWNRMQHQRAGSDYTMFTDVCCHRRAFAYPGVLADAHWFVCSGLFADWHIKTVGTVLITAVHDGNVRRDQHVISDLNIADRAVVANVGRLPDGCVGVREDCSKRDTGVRLTASQRTAIERMSQIDSQFSWNHTY